MEKVNERLIEKSGIDNSTLETIKPIERPKAVTFGLCSVCKDYFYCGYKGAGTINCNEFKPRS